MTSGKIWVKRVYDALRPAREYSIESSVFNTIVDAGYDHIVLLGPNYRLTSTVDDWLDYGMYDLDGDVDIITLRTSRMEKA
jgi:hypothetical protein